MKATKIFATLMAIGVVASAIYGMTQAGKDLVDKTLYTVGLYTVCSAHTLSCKLCCSSYAAQLKRLTLHAHMHTRTV